MNNPGNISVARAESDKLFQVLVRLHHRRVLAYALSLVKQGSDAEDIVQEAFVVAYRKLDEFDASRDFGAWVRGIVRLKYLEWVRERREVVADDETIELLETEHRMWDEASADGCTDALDALRECMKKLADSAKQVVHSFYMEHRSCSAIADVFGVNEVTIYKRLQRARDELTACVRRQVKAAGAGGNA